MGQFHFHPEGYLELMLSEMPGYHRLQDAAAAATGSGAARILELGSGTGETARRVLARHPGASLVGIDESADMLAVAREALSGADLRVARLQDELPAGPFDLVVSVLAVHHLDGPGKADLFARVAAALEPGGRFVLGDVIVPEDPADATTPLNPGFDLPSRVDEQLEWLRAAGLDASVAWAEGDLAVLVARANPGIEGSGPVSRRVMGLFPQREQTHHSTRGAADPASFNAAVRAYAARVRLGGATARSIAAASRGASSARSSAVVMRIAGPGERPYGVPAATAAG